MTGILLLIILLTAITYLYFLFKKHLRHFEELGIPYIPASSHLGFISDMIFRRRHMNDWSRRTYNFDRAAKYIGFFDFFYKPVIVLRDLDLIKDVTNRHFDCFADKPTMFDAKNDPLIGDNVSAMNGPRWREARALVTPAFTSSKMKLMFEQMSRCAERFVGNVSEKFQDPRAALDTKDLVRRFTADVIANCVYGIELDSLKVPDNEFFILGLKAANFNGITQLLKFMLLRGAPWLARLLGLKFVSDQVGNYFKGVVQEVIRTREQTGLRRPDMIQLLMDARDKTSDKLNLDLTQITAETFVFFFGGFETTATQICIMAHELAINPEIQDKLQAEIDLVLEKCSGKPTYEAINSMRYLDAVINESTRMHIPIGMLERICTKACDFPAALPGGKPLTVQPGSYIMVLLPGLHFDEKYYDRPEEFNPDRYLDDEALGNKQFPNLTFGMGPRNCIGFRFALLETKVFFFYLLAKFTLKPHSKTCNPIEYSLTEFPVVPKGGYWLSLETRDLTT